MNPIAFLVRIRANIWWLMTVADQHISSIFFYSNWIPDIVSSHDAINLVAKSIDFVSISYQNVQSSMDARLISIFESKFLHRRSASRENYFHFNAKYSVWDHVPSQITGHSFDFWCVPNSVVCDNVIAFIHCSLSSLKHTLLDFLPSKHSIRTLELWQWQRLKWDIIIAITHCFYWTSEPHATKKWNTKKSFVWTQCLIDGWWRIFDKVKPWKITKWCLHKYVMWSNADKVRIDIENKRTRVWSGFANSQSIVVELFDECEALLLIDSSMELELMDCLMILFHNLQNRKNSLHHIHFFQFLHKKLKKTQKDVHEIKQ